MLATNLVSSSLLRMSAFLVLVGCSAQSSHGDLDRGNDRAADDTSVDRPEADGEPLDTGIVGEFPYTVCGVESFPEGIRELIQDTLDEFPAVPGAVVAFYHPDYGNVIASFGVSNTSTSAPMSVDGIFDVGSVHKVFKWILVEQLVEAELIGYDEHIADYLDRPDIEAATILNLMNHSTGMVDIGLNFVHDVTDSWLNDTLPDAYTYDMMMDFLEAENSQGITNGIVDGFVLGEQHNYSSYGPLIAGNIAEEVLDQTSIEFIRSNILHALNLDSTTFIGFDPTPPVVVQGYGPDACCADVEHPAPPDSVLLAFSTGHEGPVFSTACDLLNFTRAISTPEIGFLAAETIESRTEDPIDVDGVFDVARGVFNFHGFGAGDFWGHAGDGMHGHSSFIGYNPRNGVSIVVLTNLRPQYIQWEYSVHWRIAGVLDAAFQ